MRAVAAGERPRRLPVGRLAFASTAITIGLLILASAGATAPTKPVTYKRCAHQRLSARARQGTSFPVSNLRVSRITCTRAAAAVRAGHFDETPGGLLFSTRGFACSSPIGAPLPGPPRYYACTQRGQRFQFLVPGSS